MRKVMAVVMVMMLCVSAEASDWSSYLKLDWEAVKDYTSEKWNDASDYVSGWFSGKSEDARAKVSGDNLPPAVAESWGRLTGTLGDTLTLTIFRDGETFDVGIVLMNMNDLY